MALELILAVGAALVCLWLERIVGAVDRLRNELVMHRPIPLSATLESSEQDSGRRRLTERMRNMQEAAEADADRTDVMLENLAAIAKARENRAALHLKPDAILGERLEP